MPLRAVVNAGHASSVYSNGARVDEFIPKLTYVGSLWVADLLMCCPQILVASDGAKGKACQHGLELRRIPSCRVYAQGC